MVHSSMKKCLHLTIFYCCLMFTIYQSVICIVKYLSVPKGTSIELFGLDKVGGDFPAITFCTRDIRSAMQYTAFNDDTLKACNIGKGYRAYAEDFEWVPTDIEGNIFGDNENCTNPKTLFENIVAKPSDLIHGIKYYYTKARNGSTSIKVYPNLDNGVIEINDHHKYGRCFTAIPTSEMVEMRINRITLYLKIFRNNVPITIFHAPGALTKTIFDQPKRYYINIPSYQTAFDLEYEIHRRLALGSETSCQEDNDYNYDLCKHKLAENKSLELFGCTTPFGMNKDKICTNVTVARKVMEMYANIWMEPDNQCKEPCKSYNVRPTKITESVNGSGKRKGYTKMTLNLNGKVTTSKEMFLYSGLSMLAEIGGYVGLFLGVSVNQISSLIDIFFEKYQKMR